MQHALHRHTHTPQSLANPHGNGRVAVNWNACRFFHFHLYSFSLYVLQLQLFALYAGHSVLFRALSAARVTLTIVTRSRSVLEPIFEYHRSCVHVWLYAYVCVRVRARDASRQFRMNSRSFGDIVRASPSFAKRTRVSLVYVYTGLVSLSDTNSLFFYALFASTICLPSISAPRRYSKADIPVYTHRSFPKGPICAPCLSSFIFAIH